MANRIPRLVRLPSKADGQAATLVWKLARASDWFLFDWSDESFKASGWGDVDGASTEVDATNLPGVYRVTTPPDMEDTTEFTTGWYYLFFEESASGEHGYTCFYVREGKLAEDQVFNKPLEAVDADLTKIGGDEDLLATFKAATGLYINATVDTAGFAATATEFETSDYVDANPDAQVGRTVIFFDGNRAKERGEITDYFLSGGGRGHITITTLTGAPANGDRFLVV